MSMTENSVADSCRLWTMDNKNITNELITMSATEMQKCFVNSMTVNAAIVLTHFNS